MRYYIRIFNKQTSKFVGYYKTIGKNSITAMPNGMKLFDKLEDAEYMANELNDAFLRDKDKKYYNAYTVIIGDSSKEPPKEITKTKQEKEEELEDALETFIRENRGRDRRYTDD